MSATIGIAMLSFFAFAIFFFMAREVGKKAAFFIFAVVGLGFAWIKLAFWLMEPGAMSC